MIFELVIDKEITLNIKLKLFLINSLNADALFINVDMMKCCINCELKFLIDVFF